MDRITKMETAAKVATHGQILIPAPIRKQMNIKAGTLVRLVYEAGHLEIHSIPETAETQTQTEKE